MYRSIFSALICVVLSANVFGHSFNNSFLKQSEQVISDDKHSAESSNSKSKNFVFSNPTVTKFGAGCTANSINTENFDAKISFEERVSYCEALEGISLKLNENNWSPKLREELKAIWEVFLKEKVKIRPMKKDVSKRIVAAAEAFTENEQGKGFNASLYLRPESMKKKSFFLVTMHELRHVFDFYLLYRSQTGITQSELEKRGFRIMGKIARETKETESFFRLPKVWNSKWEKLTDKEIINKREATIESYMRKSKFYKHIVKNPQKYLVGYSSNVSSEQTTNPIMLEKLKGERLPYLVSLKNKKTKLEQNVQKLNFEPQNAKDKNDAKEILNAALENEKNLYYKMDSFVYDQNLKLQCWKKEKIVGSYDQSKQIARKQNGEALFENVVTKIFSKKKMPKCIVNIDSIQTDSTETFWSAPYLSDMKVEFDYFTELNEMKVARYTVYKPTMREFEKIATKYPFVKPFRVFFGSIFVSVEDSQIVKFWGSSFPTKTITGNKAENVAANYNATAVRQKLTSGIWVTTKIDTVAVATRKGKLKPFNYVVQYQNYRQGISEVEILDDDDVIAQN